MKGLILSLLLISTAVFAAGKLQDADFKTEAQLVAAGATKAQLLNDTKIYVTSVAKTLEQAIADGDIGGGYTSPTTTAGDLIINDGGGASSDIRLPIGAAGTFPVSTGTTLQYSDQLQGVLNPVEDWVDYTSTVQNATATESFRYQRVGDTMNIEGTIEFTGGASGSIRFSMPSGFTIDEAKFQNGVVQGAGGIQVVGLATARDNSPVQYITGSILRDTSGSNTFFVTNNSGTFNATTPFTWSNQDTLSVSIYGLPIQGWTSGTNAVVRNETLEYESQIVDPNQSIGSGVWTPLSGIGYTVPKDGKYRMYSSFQIKDSGQGNFNIRLRKGGVTIPGSGGYSAAKASNQFDSVQGDNLLDLIAGEVITVEAFQNTGSNQNIGNKKLIVEQKPTSYVITGTFGTCITKKLSADISSNVTDIADLRFDNLLKVGRNYMVNMRPYYRFNNNDNMEFDAKTNGNTICRDSTGQSGGGYNSFKSTVCHFTAQSTTLTFDSRSVAVGNLINGNGSLGETYVELCTSEKEF